MPRLNLEDAVWVIGTALELAVCLLALYRKLHLRLPVFTFYLVLVLVHEPVDWGMYSHFGRASKEYFSYYWVMQCLLIGTRGLAAAELCWFVLRPYRGVWRFARLLLALTSSALVLYSGMHALQNTSRVSTFVLTAERGLEFAVLGTLIVLFGISRYYGVHFDRLVISVASGLSLYSCFGIVNNSILGVWLSEWFSAWAFFRRTSFQAALLIWIQALLRPLPQPAAEPALDGADQYLQLAPEVSGRMREMNQRLLDLLKGSGAR